MESPDIPSSLIGAVVFFGLLAMVMWLLIRETLRIVLKPALVIVVLVLLAMWAGLLDDTVIERGLSWMGDQLIIAVGTVSEWAAAAFESTRDASG